MPFFASKSNIKGQPRSLNLDFLSKNVSNYETNAVLPKMVKGISYIGTLNLSVGRSENWVGG